MMELLLALLFGAAVILLILSFVKSKQSVSKGVVGTERSIYDFFFERIKSVTTGKFKTLRIDTKELLKKQGSKTTACIA